MESKNDKLLQMIYQVFDLSKRAWKRKRQERGLDRDTPSDRDAYLERGPHSNHMEGEHRRHHGHDKLRGASLGRALTMLEENPGLRPSELAAYLEIRPQSVTGLVDRMEENGFVERVTDEQDRRVLRLYLTDKGKDMRKVASEYQSEVAEAFFDPLTEEEKETLLKLLEKLVEYHREKEPRQEA